MKTTLLIATALVGLSSFATGCAYRDAKMWQDDTTKALVTKNNEIKACYDGVLKGSPGAGGRVTVTFDVETEEGKIVNVKVDEANTTAPAPVAECVTKNIGGLTVPPPDKRTGQATFVYEFSGGAAGPTPAPKS